MQLTAEQDKAVQLSLTTRQPLFITGIAGTGKTVVLQEILHQLRRQERSVIMTAPTGLAASQLGGMTLARLLGLGISKNWEQLLDLDNTLYRADANLGEATDIVLDEVSLISGDYLQMIDRVMKEVRDPGRVFGGLRLIFCGDFLQLPPIKDQQTTVQYRWAFQYPPFHQNYPILLTKSMRQERQVDLQLLNELREGRITKLAQQFMQAAVGREIPGAVELHPRNQTVREINSRHLAELAGPMQTYRTTYDSSQTERVLQNSLPMDKEVQIKVGAPVIILVNSLERGYYNGTQGKVTSMDEGQVKVETPEGKVLTVVKHRWKVDLGADPKSPWSRLQGWAKGMPLKLGWAATIHKSQGLTLEKVRADVARCWEPGHAYVALSRATNLTQVSLVRPFEKVSADVEALTYMRSLSEE